MKKRSCKTGPPFNQGGLCGEGMEYPALSETDDIRVRFALFSAKELSNPRYDFSDEELESRLLALVADFNPAQQMELMQRIMEENPSGIGFDDEAHM